MKTGSTDKAPAAIGPYSQAKIADNNPKFVFTSGQIPVDPATGIIPDGIEEQTRQACENVKALIEESGSDMSKVIKTVCFLSDIANFGAFNKVYATYFTSSPARSCVAVKDIPKGCLVEIEAIALI